MKVQQKEKNGFCVSVSKGETHGTKVPPLVADMVHAALDRAHVSAGHFALQVTGKSSVAHPNSVLGMWVTPHKENSLRVHIKCGKGTSDQTIMGVLRVPSAHSACDLLERLKKPTRHLNEIGWARLNEKPEERANATEYFQPPAASDSSPLATTTDILSPAETSGRARSEDVSTTIPSAEMVYADALLEIIPHVSDNGVFQSRTIAPLILAIFPERKPRGLVPGLLMRFRQNGWIRRVGEGEYQIDQAFYDAIGGSDKTVQPLPIVGWKKGDKKSRWSKREKTPEKQKSFPTANAAKADASLSESRGANAPEDTLARLVNIRERRKAIRDELGYLKQKQKRLEEEDAQLEQQFRQSGQDLSREQLLALLLQ